MVQGSIGVAAINKTTGEESSTAVTPKPTKERNREAAATASKRTNSVLRNFLLAESVARSYEEGTDGASSDGNRDDSIPRGCQFSPDGTCLLTARANRLELYNTPYEDDDNDNVEEDKNKKKQREEWKPALACNSSGSVRSYTWYPHMKSSDPASCCFLGVSRDSPVHLYDAYDGSIRATYRPYNNLDEMESPTTLCFAEHGQKLVVGGFRSDRMLHVFNINRPGRDHSPPVLKLGKTRRSKDGQKGLVSAMACSENNGVVAVGTYSPGSIYLYDLRTYSRSAVAEIVMSSSASNSSGGTVCLAGHGKKGKKNKRKRFATAGGDESLATSTADIDGAAGTDNNSSSSSWLLPMNFSAAKLQWYQNRTRGGVTQVEFENNNDSDSSGGGGGNYLFSTSRRSGAILQWDLRKLSSSNFCPGIASFETENDTNQRIEFEVFGDQLWTGGTDGCVRVYSHSKPKNNKSNALLAKIDGFRDCVNGLSLHPDFNNNDSNKIRQLFPGKASDDTDGGGGTNSGSGSFDGKGVKSLLAVAIGRRHFPSESDWDADDPHTSLTNRTHRFIGSAQVYSF